MLFRSAIADNATKLDGIADGEAAAQAESSGHQLAGGVGGAKRARASRRIGQANTNADVRPGPGPTAATSQQTEGVRLRGYPDVAAEKAS